MSPREVANPVTIAGGGVQGVGVQVGVRLPASPDDAYSADKFRTGSNAFLVAWLLISSALRVVPACNTSGRFVTASLIASSSGIFSTCGGATSAASVVIISTFRRAGEVGSLESTLK